MEWEDKTIMCRLGNQMNADREPDPEKVKAFQEFVSSKLNDFDLQAVDMFITIIELIPHEIKANFDFYLPIYNKFEEMDEEIQNLGFRSGFRLEVFNEIIREEMLKRKQNLIQLR